MPDTTTTLRPNGDEASYGSDLSPVGAATIWQALSDNSDSTYMDTTTAGNGGGVDLTTFTIPALAIVRRVTTRLRAKGAGTIQVNLWVGSSVIGNTTPILTSTITTYTVGSYTSPPGFFGGPWSQAAIDSLQAAFFSSDTSNQAMALYIDVVYNRAPTATVTGPTGTITSSSRPAVTWTYSDPEGDAQERYRVKIFSAAQYGAAGFNPATSTATWDSGQVLSAATTATPANLANGTYRAYVQVADVGSGGRWGNWSAFSGFTVNIPTPAAPTVTATAEPSNGRVTLTVTDGNGSLTGGFTYSIAVERSADGGTTWVPVRMSLLGLVTPAYDPIDITSAGQVVPNIHDYEAPYGSLLYRAIETADDGSGNQFLGPYSSSTSADFEPADTWLLDPLAPANRMTLDLQLPLQYGRRNRTAVADTLGATYPTARTDGPKGQAGKAVVDTVGQAEHDSLDGLVGSGRTLLLRIPAGEPARYIVVTSDPALDTTVLTLGDSTSSYRQSSFEWTEIAAP